MSENKEPRKNEVSADEALELLKKGNIVYQNDKERVNASKAIREELLNDQIPYAILLSCADSRVIPESIFDANLGDLFVVRVAGNIANTSSIASIEYAVANIRTKLIVVLGHESCGAVGAAMAGGDNGYNLNMLCAHIMPAVEAVESGDKKETIVKNAQLNAIGLKDRSEIISDWMDESGSGKDGPVKIVYAYYNFASGKVDFY